MNSKLTERLQNYIASMAPHQRERLGGKLMVEALAEIKRLEKELEHVIASREQSDELK